MQRTRLELGTGLQHDLSASPLFPVNEPEGITGKLIQVWLMARSRRTRTAKVRTALSCPCPAGQTDNGQSFFWKSGQKRDTDRTRTVLSADVCSWPDILNKLNRKFAHEIRLDDSSRMSFPVKRSGWRVEKFKFRKIFWMSFPGLDNEGWLAGLVRVTLIRKLLRTTILNQRYYSRINVAHIFISGTVGDWTQNAKLELENVTHRDILQTSLQEIGDINGDKNAANENDQLSAVLKNYIVWNWFEENCYQVRDSGN